MVTIPFSGNASFSQEVTLDGVAYRFQFSWNVRGNFWSMTIMDRDLNVLVAGVKIVLSYELIADWVGRSLPPGELYAIDTTSELLAIGRDDMGDLVTLGYVPEAEVDAI